MKQLKFNWIKQFNNEEYVYDYNYEETITFKIVS